MKHRLFDKKYYFENQENIVDGIAINPLLPDDFYYTANEERDSNELAHWWGRPFITTEPFKEDNYEVYCRRMIAFDVDYKLDSLEVFTLRREQEKRLWNERYVDGLCYKVHCLTGGAGDRPSMLGYSSTLEEALSLAKERPKMYQFLDDEGFLDLSIGIKEMMGE